MLFSDFRWGLLRATQYTWVNGTADRVGCLNCVSQIFIPTIRERPCLGSLFLAQWPTTSITAWHEIRKMGARPLQWPVKIISDEQLLQFREALLAAEQPTEEPPPCNAGDKISITFPGVTAATAHCLWASKGAVGVKIIFLGREATLTLPYNAVLAVLPQ